MCEILIFVGNKTLPDTVKDRRGCYKKGYIVVVHDDGHIWGREESKQQWISEGLDPLFWPNQGIFVIVKLPGILTDKANELLSQQVEDDTGVSLQDAEGYPLPFRRRRWKVLFDNLSVGVRSTLSTSGEITLSTGAQRQAFRDQLKRIRDSLQYTGLD